MPAKVVVNGTCCHTIHFLDSLATSPAALVLEQMDLLAKISSTTIKKLIAARDQISILRFGTTPLVARETQYFISFRKFYSYQWMRGLVV